MEPYDPSRRPDSPPTPKIILCLLLIGVVLLLLFLGPSASSHLLENWWPAILAILVLGTGIFAWATLNPEARWAALPRRLVRILANGIAGSLIGGLLGSLAEVAYVNFIRPDLRNFLVLLFPLNGALAGAFAGIFFTIMPKRLYAWHRQAIFGGFSMCILLVVSSIIWTKGIGTTADGEYFGLVALFGFTTGGLTGASHGLSCDRPE